MMSARENFTSFYRTQLRRLLRVCRCVSRSAASDSSEDVLGNTMTQQFPEGTAYLEALPALPTSAQIAERGGKVLYRQRYEEETEPILLPAGCAPAGCAPQQDVLAQVRLSPSCDMLLPAVILFP